MTFRDAGGRLLKGNPLAFKKGNVPWNKGKQLSEEGRRKLSEAHRGRVPWNKGKKMSDEYRLKLSIAHKGQKISEETKRKISEANKGRIVSEETRRKISESLMGHVGSNLGKKFSEEHKRKISEAHKGKIVSEEARQNMSRATKKMWDDPEYRKRMSESHTGLPFQGLRHHSEETKKLMSQRAKERWEVPGFRENMIKRRKEAWQDPDYVRKQMKARNVQPNKPEQFLIDLFEEHGLPFRYVGAGDFILGGKCPDFLNYNGKKQLIELFGNYWHKGEDPQDRIDFFKGYGFSTLVIWESELSNPSDVLTRVESFGVV